MHQSTSAAAESGLGWGAAAMPRVEAMPRTTAATTVCPAGAGSRLSTLRVSASRSWTAILSDTQSRYMVEPARSPLRDPSEAAQRRRLHRQEGAAATEVATTPAVALELAALASLKGETE